MLGVEPGGDLVEDGLVDRPVRHRHPHLERLAEVAQVGGPDELVLLRREALIASASAARAVRSSYAAATVAGSSASASATWVCT